MLYRNRCTFYTLRLLPGGEYSENVSDTDDHFTWNKSSSGIHTAENSRNRSDRHLGGNPDRMAACRCVWNPILFKKTPFHRVVKECLSLLHKKPYGQKLFLF